MTGRRALVQRPHRKMHLAVQLEDLSWFSFCDRALSAEGMTVQLLDSHGGVRQHLVNQQRRIVAQAAKPGVCAHCRRFLMLVELLQRDAAYGTAHRFGLTA